MTRASLIDGSLHPDEFKLLCDVGAKYDLAGHDVKTLVKQTRSELYRQAPSQLRTNRHSANGDQANAGKTLVGTSPATGPGKS